MSETADSGAISRTRFLVIDTDRASLDRLERYLLMSAAQKVHVATSPLQALRILQDRRTPIDCVICPVAKGAFSGLDFLENLRMGRWGSALKDKKFILTMRRVDEQSVQLADSFNVNGYLIGEVDRDVAVATITKALTEDETEGPLTRFPVAHVRLTGADVILVPVDAEFAALSNEQRSGVFEAFRRAAGAARLAGTVAPVWANGEAVSFIAPQEFHGALGQISVAFVRENLNRRLSVASTLPIASGARKGAPFWPDGTVKKTAAAKGAGGGVALDGEGEEMGVARRPMTHEDIGKIILGMKQLGPEKFAKAFLQHQIVASRSSGGEVVPVEREYFFSIDRIRKTLLRDVNLRSSADLYREMTLALDQAAIRCFPYFPDTSKPFSLNLNVQTIFTKTFEALMQRLPPDITTIEFRQANVVEFYDEYVTARAFLESKGVRVSIDRIFPDTLGLVNLEFLGVKRAKMHWNASAEDTLKNRKHVLAYLKTAGVDIILSRVDEQAGLEFGEKFGIGLFQGHLIEELLTRGAAAAA